MGFLIIGSNIYQIPFTFLNEVVFNCTSNIKGKKLLFLIEANFLYSTIQLKTKPINNAHELKNIRNKQNNFIKKEPECNR